MSLLVTRRYTTQHMAQLGCAPGRRIELRGPGGAQDCQVEVDLGGWMLRDVCDPQPFCRLHP